MTQRIAIIDYGMGNLHSVAKAVAHVAGSGDDVRVTHDSAWIRNADRVVFPGQGAARDCMAALHHSGIHALVLEMAATKPFLGICMGLQVLLEHSEENAGTSLLGLYAGAVRFFGAPTNTQGQRLKIPHMGWNRVFHTQKHPLWAGILDGSRFYFVHSYYVAPHDQNLIAGTTEYGQSFVSALAHAGLFAVQFHPEKSADDGLQLLANFIRWNP